MRGVLLLALIGLVSCGPETTPDALIDNDGDGHPAYLDCNDDDELVNLDADEVCGDLIDNDCSGAIDEDSAVDATEWYVDGDGDGQGDATATRMACLMPAGYADNGDDCNDGNPSVYDGAPEDECTSTIDYNCDGSVARQDLDGDGVAACESDCDDADPWSYPGATEICDGVDNDCNGSADGADAVDARTWYADTDDDGFGDADASVVECDAPDGYVANADDCDDDDATANPDGLEVCGGGDEDCDGRIDDGADDATVWYRDLDGDTYGNPNLSSWACVAPAGHVADNTDCDDGKADVNPAGSETCDGADNDCNGDVDDGATGSATWYADRDGDGFGDAASTIDECSPPAGYVGDNTDCDDLKSNTNPMADEWCDAVDHNCDGDTAAGGVDAPLWYWDGDGDGYGVPQVSMASCTQPTGYVSNTEDCDGGNGDNFPGATEWCDGEDNDCDGTSDEPDAADAETWWFDEDWDGFGNPANAVTNCFVPPYQYVDDDIAVDCDDLNQEINPAQVEYCWDNVDNNCDAAVDEDTAVDAPLWYDDTDGDMYGNPALSTNSCNQPAGYVADWTDCDPTDGTNFPGADERCDAVDNNCDTVTDEPTAIDAPLWYQDEDGDGFGDLLISTPACFVPPAGYVPIVDINGDGVLDGDCDDEQPTMFPQAAETACDGLDNDCDFIVDEGVKILVHRDADLDTWGDQQIVQEACGPSPGWVVVPAATPFDCNDNSATTNPVGVEICDGLDNDCAGGVDDNGAGGTIVPDWYVDADGDGYGSPSSVFSSCVQPAGFVALNTDCDDGEPLSNPGMTEVCDYLDNDCANGVDDGVTFNRYHVDADGDGYGAQSSFIDICDVNAPAGYLPAPPSIGACNGGTLRCTNKPSLACATSSDCWDWDCNDGDIDFFPGPASLVEVCNGGDNNCDGIPDNNGFDSDGDGLDNCNDPTVYFEGFNDPGTGNDACGPGTWGAIAPGWTTNDFQDMACCGAGSLGMPIFPAVPAPDPSDWHMGCPDVHQPGEPQCSIFGGPCGIDGGGVLFSGHVDAGHTVAVGPDMGQLQVFTVGVDIEPTNVNLDAAGIVLDYEDPQNFFLIRWDDPINSYARPTSWEFIRCLGGACTLLDQSFVAPQPAFTVLTVYIQVRYDQLFVYVDSGGGPVLEMQTITNGGDIGPGRVGLYTFDADTGMSFDNLTVTQP